MPIPLEHENDPDARGLYECCCFCWQPTPWWTEIAGRRPGEQVACCQGCAKTHRVKDVPSKRYWCDMADRLRKAREEGYRSAVEFRSSGRVWCRNAVTS